MVYKGIWRWNPGDGDITMKLQQLKIWYSHPGTSVYNIDPKLKVLPRWWHWCFISFEVTFDSILFFEKVFLLRTGYIHRLNRNIIITNMQHGWLAY